MLVGAVLKRPGKSSALDRYPFLPEHLLPCVSAWYVLGGLRDGPRPADIAAHLDLCGEESPAERRRVYVGVMALASARSEWEAEQRPRK